MTTSSLYPAVGSVATRNSISLDSDSLNLIFAVLRLSPLGDVEAGHNLQTRHDGAAIALRDLHIFKTVAIDPESYKRFALFSIRLDMNIGRILTIGVGDNLIGQVARWHCRFHPARPSGSSMASDLRLGDEFAENIGHVLIEFASSAGLALSGRGSQKLGDVPAETDGEPNVEAWEGPFDVCTRSRSPGSSVRISIAVRSRFSGIQ